MKNLNPFLKIGTIGMIITALLHIGLAVLFPSSSVHNVFFALYPAFLSFLVFGATQMKQLQKQPIRVQSQQRKFRP